MLRRAGVVRLQLRKGFYRGGAASPAMPANASKLNLDPTIIIRICQKRISSFCGWSARHLRSPQVGMPPSGLSPDVG